MYCTSHAKTLGKYRLSCHVHPFWASKAGGLTLRPIIQCGSIIIHDSWHFTCLLSVVDEIPHGFGPSTFRHSILPTHQNPFTHWAQIYALHLLAHCGLRSRSIVPREIWSWVFLDCWSITWKPGLLILHPNTSDPVSWDMINQWILLETDSETDSDVTGATTDHGYCSLDHPVPSRLDHSPSNVTFFAWWSMVIESSNSVQPFSRWARNHLLPVTPVTPEKNVTTGSKDHLHGPNERNQLKEEGNAYEAAVDCWTGPRLGMGSKTTKTWILKMGDSLK